ncbi:Putative Anaphase promoting complex subunit 10 [[Torrubiella] hemipterigena]|uniref:Putative Anaphase promoting complex subunit 10 n=2 Tax=[Torrubiella] hemipterigena TaxID=1531966 RepID=A0A0A1T0Z2_9HYPO|nr:Putative Anaphase promoting complex subunit 10 [[Torrubiella] hemipterigena]
MDINRGARRARHVASNLATGNPADEPRRRSGARDLAAPPRQRALDAHRTPDTRADDGDGDALPPPRANPFRLHRAVPATSTPRLSLPMGSDDSGSDPEISVLEMVRGGGRAAVVLQNVEDDTFEEEEEEEEDSMSQEIYERDPEETSLDEHDVEEQIEEQAIEPLLDPSAVGLKEISNLGKFTVSSHKPGSGVEELRSDNLKLFWQSDGPQPHKLTIYFVKRVGIRVIRFYVDYREDESYTPTKIVFKSGTSENNLIEFATMNMDSPYGWQDVPIAGAGGDPDGNTLVSYVLQMQILENHQNGKDTHLRGIKIYAFDPDISQDTITHQADEDAEAVAAAFPGSLTSSQRLSEVAKMLADSTFEMPDPWLAQTEGMREPEIR